MQTRLSLLLLSGLLLWIGCDQSAQSDDPLLDRQVRFQFEGPEATTDPNGVRVDEVIKFNIDHYPRVDSVVFVADLSSDEEGESVYAELRSVTTDEQIAELETSGTTPRRLESDNIVEAFPQDEDEEVDEITLTVRIRPESEGTRAFLANAWLFLYRDV